MGLWQCSMLLLAHAAQVRPSATPVQPTPPSPSTPESPPCSGAQGDYRLGLEWIKARNTRLYNPEEEQVQQSQQSQQEQQRRPKSVMRPEE